MVSVSRALSLGRVAAEFRPLAGQTRMVMLHGEDGYAFGLTIDGYEYPDIVTGYDGNWLFVRVDIQHPRGDWWFRSAWMTTLDARRLIDWLEGAVVGSVEYEWTTYELVFTFALTPMPGSLISVVVTRGALPQWHGANDGRELILKFGRDADDIRMFAENWKAQVARFPVRGKLG
jgi:hypothetical protein